MIVTEHRLTPAQRWEALKVRGNPTAAEIEAIDRDTPWQEVEPRWWIEMMEFSRQLELDIVRFNR